ncbi:hypothetical protein FKM82_018386 [Ascaphus truei]
MEVWKRCQMGFNSHQFLCFDPIRYQGRNKTQWGLILISLAVVTRGLRWGTRVMPVQCIHGTCSSVGEVAICCNCWGMYSRKPSAYTCTFHVLYFRLRSCRLGIRYRAKLTKELPVYSVL